MPKEASSRLKVVLAALLGGLLFLILAAVGLAAGYQVHYQERFFPGVSVAGLDLSGLALAGARPLVEARLQQELSQELVLIYGDESWRYTLSHLGLQADVPALLEQALLVGRGPDLVGNLQEQWHAWLEGVDVQPQWQLDEGAALVALGRIARQIEQPARNGRLELAGSQIVAVEPQIGRKLDVEGSRQAILERVRSRSGGQVELVVERELPAVRDIAAARQTLEAMLDRRLLLTSESDDWTEDGRWQEETLSWELGPEQLASYIAIAERRNEDGSIRLEPEWRREGFEAFVAGLAPAIDQEVGEGRFRFDPQLGQAVPVVASQEGRTLEVGAAAAVYAALLQEREQVELPVTRVRADSSLTGAEAAQIVELASEGTTSFRGSSAVRVTNIAVAAARYDGLAIQPGAVFSFGQYLGDVTEEEGYVVGLIIQGNETVEGLGGGICQVSTTMFRAAFFGGFPIVERWPHAYRLGYYEPPVGLDATVFTPYVDMKFHNDQETPLLVHTSVDKRKGTITYSFYGVKPSRRVELEGPYVANIVPHPEPLRIEDPTLPEGTVEQVDWAQDGASVSVYRLIYEGDQLVSREGFHSTYRAWQAKYLVGTATTTASTGSEDSGG